MTQFAAKHADIIGFVHRSRPHGGWTLGSFAAPAISQKVAVRANQRA